MARQAGPGVQRSSSAQPGVCACACACARTCVPNGRGPAGIPLLLVVLQPLLSSTTASQPELPVWLLVGCRHRQGAAKSDCVQRARSCGPGWVGRGLMTRACVHAFRYRRYLHHQVLMFVFAVITPPPAPYMDALYESCPGLQPAASDPCPSQPQLPNP